MTTIQELENKLREVQDGIAKLKKKESCPLEEGKPVSIPNFDKEHLGTFFNIYRNGFSGFKVVVDESGFTLRNSLGSRDEQLEWARALIQTCGGRVD